MIDSLAEALIDKDQFTSRVARTKARIAELDAKIASQAAQDEQRANVRAVMSRLTELSDHLRVSAERRRLRHEREIIRAVVQRIEIGPKKISVVLRLSTETGARVLEPIVVTLPRMSTPQPHAGGSVKAKTGERNSG